MKATFTILALLAMVSLPALAQQVAGPDPLLDRMTGHWVLQGMIAGRETTHDVEVEWVLGHEYLRLHEISREKAGPRMKRSCLLSGMKPRASIGASGSTPRAAAGSPGRRSLTGSAMAIRFRFCSRARTAIFTPLLRTTRATTPGGGLWTTRMAESCCHLPA